MDDTFTSAQFSINWFFVPHRLDRIDKSDGTLLYVRETFILLLLLKNLKKQGYYTKNEEMFAFSYWKRLKKKYYKNLDLHDVTDTKRFWKTVKPVFRNKVNKICNTISLIEKFTVITSVVLYIEVIRPILNFLFFLKKRLYTHKKHKKAQNKNKQLSLRCT